MEWTERLFGNLRNIGVVERAFWTYQKYWDAKIGASGALRKLGLDGVELLGI